jgi:hypothetical protein
VLEFCKWLYRKKTGRKVVRNDGGGVACAPSGVSTRRN